MHIEPPNESEESVRAVFITVSAYRDLAHDARNRCKLVKDTTCLHFLVFVLCESNVECIVAALETLWYLSEQKQYRSVLKRTYYLLKALETISSNSGTVEYPSIAIDLSNEIYERLNNHRHPLRDTSNISAIGIQQCKPNINSSRLNNDLQRTGVGVNVSGVSKPRQFLAHNNTARTVVLQLGVDTTGQLDSRLPWCECKSLCQRLLLPLTGVISVTYQSHRRRCMVRINVKQLQPQDLVLTLNNSNDLINAVHVVKDKVMGKDVYRSYSSSGACGRSPVTDCVTVPVEMPSYLAEDDSMEVRLRAARSPAGNTAALTTKPPRARERSGWLATAANFLNNTFYW